MNILTLINALPGAAAQGLIWGIMAIGVYLTFRILDVADLTVDGTMCTGGAVCVMMLMSGHSVWVSMLAATGAGMLAGLATGIFHTFMGIPAILAGILTQLGLYSANLKIMGKANQAVNGNKFDLLVSLRNVKNVPFYQNTILIVAVFVVVLIAILYWFFGTELGMCIRATGFNPQMVRAQGVNTDTMTIIGLFISNALIGLCGAVVAQNKSLVITSAQTILGKAPWNILIAVGLGALMFYLHKYSVFGSNCRAVGGDAQLAKNAGIDKYKVYGKGFLVASFYAGFSAIISLSRGAGTAAATGLQSMTPIFSAMIGVFLGLMLTRWVNIVFGVISGILTMNIIGYGLLALSVEPDIKNTITGAFLLTIMTIMAVRERKAMEKVKRDLFNMQRVAKQVQYVKQEE